MNTELGTPNQKAVYSRNGMIADLAHNQLQEKPTAEWAKIELDALKQQTGAQETEIKRLHALVKTDEHNRKFGSNLKLRNLESKKFDDTINGNDE